jgi:hypothetical protein
VLVRLRADRCFYADPPPAARSPKGGRPRRHGARFAFADPTTWPTPTATLVSTDDQYGAVTVQAWSKLHPKQQRHPVMAAEDRARSCAAPSSAWLSSVSRLERAHRRCCGCGGLASANSTWISPGGLYPPVRPGTHRPLRQADPRLDDPAAVPPRTGRPVDLAGAHLLCPAALGPPGSPVISDCHGNGRDHSRGCHRCGSGVGFRSFWPGSARRPLRRNPPGAPQVDPKAASLGQPRAIRRSRSRPRTPAGS